MEENFEKKSSKKVGIIITVVVLLLVIGAIVGGIIYLNSTRKPEKIFAKTIEDTFQMVKTENYRKAKMELELSAEINAEDAEIKAVNEMLKAIKLKATLETDLDKKIFNENLLATYDGEQVISVDLLVQDNKMYAYLNDLFSKYIEFNEADLEGVDLSSIFTATEAVEVDENLLKDIKQILIDEVNSRELTQEKTKLNDENVLKTTLRLTPNDILDIAIKILNKINEYENIPELEEAIEDLRIEMEYSDETENYVDISVYTKGLKNDLVKAEVLMIDKDYDEAIIFELEKNSEQEYTISMSLNEESTSVSEATELMSITVNEENENKGTIKFEMNIEDQGSIVLNINYNVDYNVNIEKRDVSNSIDANSLTEEDAMEIRENIQKNEILYGLLELMMTSQTTTLLDQASEAADSVEEALENEQQMLENQQQTIDELINEM